MRDLFITVTCIMILNSCASSTFYAYYNIEDEVYCTMEVDRKGISTYRGIIYPKYSDWSYKRFIYIKSRAKNIEGYLDLRDIFAIYHIDEFNDYFDCSHLFFESDSCILNNRISYWLEGDSAYYPSFICIQEHPTFLEANRGFSQLAPYFKKVDKIDYSKFSMFKVKKKYLKNPEKKRTPMKKYE